ncbi:hypothetical protein QTV42_004421 [Vibrio vulnificus]|nr:hypothetical protein [Vibrio vulnificus]ELP6772929.1 hypothetical protein [Vibrio vulnificus]
MARDLTLYPKKASKKDLKELLESLGFVRCKHLWDWPKGTLNYSWYENDDFKSIDGVSADIYPVSGEELAITGNTWAIHVRNTYSASYHDVEMLNYVLRLARKRFGGTIKGDYGTNRYAPLWDDHSTPISRGASAIYFHVTDNMRKVKHSLPEPVIDQKPVNNTVFAKEFTDDINSRDPSRIIYNGLVPFAISMFEFFFSELFQVLIKHDEFAVKKRNEHKQKIDFSVLLDVSNGKRSLESVIAEQYTFQNLNQLNKAYKDWLNIDVKKLYGEKKMEDTVDTLESRIDNIIQYRHGVVHNFMIDSSLTKDGYIEILDTVSLCIHEVLEYVQEKYDFELSMHH